MIRQPFDQLNALNTVVTPSLHDAPLATQPLRATKPAVMVILALGLLVILGSVSVVRAADINSNGVGGGMWNDPSTWRGNQIPKAEDDVTIARGDTITFDRDDQSRVSCNKLYIDPNGSLQFKTASGKITMVVADAIESYGSIKIDAARIHGDTIELRMTGGTQDQRTLTLMRGGSLTIAGKRFVDPKDASAILSCHPTKDGFTETSNAMVIKTAGEVAIDLHNARFDGVAVQASNIDNTGAFAGQRLNVIGNYFQGLSSITFSSCDTPVVADNLFINTHERAIDIQVIYITSSPLPTIRNNVIKVKATRGIYCYGVTDPLIQNNVIEGVTQQGLMVNHSTNVMIQGNKVINSKVGYYMRTRSGVIRDSVADGCDLPFQSYFSNQQFINIKVVNPVKDKPWYAFRTSTSIFFNTQIQPGNVVASAGNRDEVLIAHQPLIVKVKGTVPAGSVVEVIPTDQNMSRKGTYPPVVNSPASLNAQGLTPTMITGSALMVRSWQQIAKDQQDEQAEQPNEGAAGEESKDDQGITNPLLPTYQVRVLGPEPAGKNAQRPVLATTAIQPDATWYRADLADNSPMVEITVP